MGSSNQEPGVSLRTDGWLQKPIDSLMRIPDKIQSSLKLHFGRFLKTDGVSGGGIKAQMPPEKVRVACTAAAASEVSLDRQLQAWRDNPSWTDQPPEIKEVVSRNVLLDEGSRQIVEVEQAAIWKFLWWSGILSVHVFVDQDRRNHTVKFKQGRSGFMKKFEGCWKIEPLFVDKEACLPLDPHTLEEYDSCSAGRGRVGSAITLDQLIEPALLPPQPIAWYVRGITTRTTEMLVNDLIAETARLRGLASNGDANEHTEENRDVNGDVLTEDCNDVKERWRQRRKAGRHGSSLRLTQDNRGRISY
ncbi:hypothetical protein CFC21_065612 [Triticum aestivum]|uniref:DUF220 domain-containing protein n=2 Tax=Triticum aestivum TaxID=4565 RepID=A0A3B6KI98_WHEAT|nr:hypothetical protein CFC21_065612 [Triticum aestivum]